MGATPQHLLELPIYRKALDIHSLSHRIAMYLNDDLSELQSDGKEDNAIYFSGDMIQQSSSLAPEIAYTEINKPCVYTRRKHLTLLKKQTNRLYNSVKRLERCRSNGKEYLQLLKLELKTFKTLQNHWMLTL